MTIGMITALHFKVTSAHMLKLTFYPLGHNFTPPPKNVICSYLRPFTWTLIKEK